ncbi:serine hydrolase [Aurantiacibacter sp. MUD61]|uniref:serine hydrolase n=1 Tax=Aurantiacibacter sp. MUD61 TaxID=3009083 RepID=UPI0022F028BE|nr:serine hydrolase [Aurantiacibacter sp. MUD61]
MHRIASAIAASAAIVIAAPAQAQDVQGYWEGTLDAGTVQLPLGVNIERQDDGTLSGTLDSPSQNAFDIPLEDVEATDTTLSFTVPAVGGRYRAEWDTATESWIGLWTQAGQSLALTLVAAERPEREAAAATPQLPEEWDIPADADIASILTERLMHRPGTGIVVGAITPDGTRVVSQGPSPDGAFDADTVFEIGSITKVFVALLLADMANDGLVSLDDPVSDYLPDGATIGTFEGQPITLRHLARHESGLPRLPSNLEFSDIRNPYADYGEEDLLAFLASYEPERAPGSEYAYSNLGFGLLGYALERAGGSDLEVLLRNRILDPLDMGDTGIVLTADQQSRFATGRDEYNRETLAWDLGVLTGAGALRSTPADMLKFAAAAMDPSSPLAPAMLLTMSDLRQAPGYRSGLGWMVVPAPSGVVVMHGGGTGGFRAHVALQEESGQGVVVLTNSAIEPSTQDIALHFLVGAPLSEAGPVPEAPETVVREEVELTDAQLDRVVGTYRFAPGLELTVTRITGGLEAALTGQAPLRIYPRAPLEFFLTSVNGEIVFTQEDGEITGAVFTQDGRESTAVRVD